jgi:putative transposase
LQSKITHRRSIRLPRYDYSQTGGYFVIICTRSQECLFGEIEDGEMRLNDRGVIAHAVWFESTKIRQEIKLDKFVVMPNHLHAVVFINRVNKEAIRGSVRATGGSPSPEGRRFSPGPAKWSLGSLVGGFKSSVTKRINEMLRAKEVTVWQRNYYEHVRRNEEELNRIRQYIRDNSKQWELDRENPANTWATRRSPLQNGEPWTVY